MSHYTVFSAIVACFCLFLPASELTAEDATLAQLRDRIEVLDQARDKAAAELSAKEQQGLSTNRDQVHFRTVTGFLERQIEESCRQLIEKGGIAAAADLPCPNTGAQKEIEYKLNTKSPAAERGAQTSAKQKEEVVEALEKKDTSSVTVQPVEPPPLEKGTVNREKTKVSEGQVQQDKNPGFIERIRQWLKSLFAPKPPPATSGNGSGQPAQKGEKTTDEQENAQKNGDSNALQTVQNTTPGTKGAAVTSSKREQSDNSAGKEITASKEKGAAQEQEQQLQENGVKQAVVDGEKSGYQAGHELAQENGVKGAESGGDNDSSSGDTVVVGSGTTKQIEKQGGKREAAMGITGAGEKGAGREEDTNKAQGIREGGFSSGAGKKRTADVGPGDKGLAVGREKGTGQQVPVQPDDQLKDETDKKQPGAVVSSPAEEKKTEQPQQKGFGSPSGKDAEVAKLEQSLSDALSEFDGKLLSEQERLGARIPKQREGSAGGGYGVEGPLGPDGGGGAAGYGYESSGSEVSDDRTGSGGYGPPGTVSSDRGKSAPAGGRTSIDTDDDIVARQLREAAEKETDPELKEKLWQEYRKYKQGVAN